MAGKTIAASAAPRAAQVHQLEACVAACLAGLAFGNLTSRVAMVLICGALSQLTAGRMFDPYGVAGMFGMIAAMYVIFAVAVQFAPETFGKSIEGEAEPSAAAAPLQPAVAR